MRGKDTRKIGQLQAQDERDEEDTAARKDWWRAGGRLENGGSEGESGKERESKNVKMWSPIRKKINEIHEEIEDTEPNEL